MLISEAYALMSLRVLVGVSRSTTFALHSLGTSPAASRHWSATCDARTTDILSSGHSGNQAAPNPQSALGPDPSSVFVACPASHACQDAPLPATSATPRPAPWWGLLSSGAHLPAPCVGVRALASLSSLALLGPNPQRGFARSRPSNYTTTTTNTNTNTSNSDVNSLLPHLRLLHQASAPHGPGAGPREDSTEGGGRAPRARDTAAGHSPHPDGSSVDKARDRSGGGSGSGSRGGRGEGGRMSAPRRGGPAAPSAPSAKELQLGPRIGQHDLRTKLRRAEGWLASGLR